MAIDVEHRAKMCHDLGMRAIKLEAIREEVVKALRVAYYVCTNHELRAFLIRKE